VATDGRPILRQARRGPRVPRSPLGAARLRPYPASVDNPARPQAVVLPAESRIIEGCDSTVGRGFPDWDKPACRA